MISFMRKHISYILSLSRNSEIFQKLRIVSNRVKKFALNKREIVKNVSF